MSWSLHPVFDSYAFVVVAVLAMLVVMLAPMYRRLTVARRLTLLSLRTAVVLLILLLMLRPTAITTTSQPQPRVYMVLFDQSRSMQLPSARGEGDRWQQLQRLLDGVESALANPGEAMEVKLFAFDTELSPVGAGGWRELQPDGAETDLGGASDAALRLLRGKRLVGATVISDGVQTAFNSKVDVHRAARELGRLGVPLLTVPLGPPGDATQARDVAMESLPEQLSGFVGNDLPLTGVVKVQGYVNQPIQVRLLLEGDNGQQRELGTAEIVALEDGQQLPVPMVFSPPAVGDYKLTMEVAEQNGEMVTANNSLTCYVRVREGLKVAYLYGTVLGEQRALRWSLSAGTGVQLVTRFINPRLQRQWPLDQADLLGADDVDAYLIESVPAAAFRKEDLQRLADQVAAGKGLMMLGGYYSFGPGGYQDGPLANVLPVQMGRFERQDVGLDRPLSQDLHWTPPEGVRISPVGDHPIMRLGAPGDSEAIWRTLPPLIGVNKLEPAKFAQVLAVAQNGQPVLLSSQHGTGRVLAFAGDTTHRWWSRGRKEQHKRFWRQAVMWLIGREAPKNDVWIRLARRRFQPGDRVPIRGGARDGANREIDAQYTLTLTLPDGQQKQLPLQTVDGRSPVPTETSAGGKEVVAETESLRDPGDYRLLLQAKQQDTLIGTAESSFQVMDRDVELATVAADHQQLQRLAMLTKDAGGRLLQPEQWPAVLEEQLSQPATVEVDTESRWQLGGNPTDAWLILMAMVGLLTAEWTLRKRWGLV